MWPILSQHRFRTLTWRIAPLTPSSPLSFSVVSTRTIHQTASCDWWQSVRNELLWLGLSCAGRHEAGRVWKREGSESVNADLNRIRGGDVNIQTCCQWRKTKGLRSYWKLNQDFQSHLDWISEKQRWVKISGKYGAGSVKTAKIKIKALDFFCFARSPTSGCIMLSPLITRSCFNAWSHSEVSCCCDSHTSFHHTPEIWQVLWTGSSCLTCICFCNTNGYLISVHDLRLVFSKLICILKISFRAQTYKCSGKIQLSARNQSFQMCWKQIEKKENPST